MRAKAQDRMEVEPAPQVQAARAMADAVAALRAGERAKAADLARAILDSAVLDRAVLDRATDTTPEPAAAHFLLAALAEEDGHLDTALDGYARAIACAPANAGYRVAHGNLAFARGDAATAESSYRGALALDPFAAAIHNNIGQALKRQGRTREAVHHFRQSLELGRGSRWFARSATPGRRADPLRAESFATTSRAKLEHDIEQFEHLLAKGALPPGFAAELEGYRALRDTLPADAPCRHWPLDDRQRAAIGASYNRVVHLPPATPVPAEVLNPALDLAAVERGYAGTTPRLAVVDDLLTDAALAQLRDFCLDATIWFDCKADGGYLGAYLHDGFAPPVLLALADALREGLPGIFGDLALTQMWALKYPSAGRGTRPHADQAEVNVNFWITPDEDALPGQAGGLRVWTEAAPGDWPFPAYNHDAAPIAAHLADTGAQPIDLAYRCNRAAIFDSSLFHESLPFSFRPGYASRRINVTMLFGHRSEGVMPPTTLCPASPKPASQMEV